MTISQKHAFNGLHPVIHVITWITTHLPTPKGWKAGMACRLQLIPKANSSNSRSCALLAKCYAIRLH